MDKYFFSIILFSEIVSECIKTISNLKEQENRAFGVQIIVVNDNQAVPDHELEMQVHKVDPQAQIVPLHDPSGSVVKRCIALVQGKYVCFSQSGVTYEKNSLLHIWQSIKATKMRTVMIPFRVKKKIRVMDLFLRPMNFLHAVVYKAKVTEIAAEHNEFCRHDQPMIDLEKKFQLVPALFPAFFTQKDAIVQEENEVSQHGDSQREVLRWPYLLLKLLFLTVLKDKKVGCVRKAACDIKDFKQLTDMWENELDIPEARAAFHQDFLASIFQYVKTDRSLCTNAAKYSLLFYCNLLQTKVNQQEISTNSITEQDLKKTTQEMLHYIGKEALIISNRYIAKEYKGYYLRNFALKKVTDPEYIKKKNRILDRGREETEFLFMDLDEKYLYLEGAVTLSTLDRFEIFIRMNAQQFNCEKKGETIPIKWFDLAIGQRQYFKVHVPLAAMSEKNKIEIICKCQEEEYVKSVYSLGKYVPIADSIPLYFRKNNRVLYYDKKCGSCVLANDTFSRRMQLQWRLDRKLLFSLSPAAKLAFGLRKLNTLLRIGSRKQIWLLSDRVYRGDDNGEALFRYLVKQDLPGKKLYFVVNKASADYKRMKSYGHVISTFSLGHRMIHLRSEYLISSQGNAPVVNPYGRYSEYFKDIMINNKFIFLQHGITKDNQSAWLNRYNRNIYGLVVTTKPEYDSMFEYEYDYSPERIWLTGMPRYDRLYYDEKKYITIMPTWRKSLSAGTNHMCVWTVGAQFLESAYFKFYNDLLNDERLIAAAKEKGYRICFMPHPNIASAIKHFKRNPEVIFFSEDKSYREVFAETDLMVTDYSSVAFDFAYLRKPMVYCHFDRDDFFSGTHTYTEGYFDYERDGFGEVELDYDAAIERMIEYMNEGCQLKPKYRERINQTFAFNDKESCKRVLDKLLEQK